MRVRKILFLILFISILLLALLVLEKSGALYTSSGIVKEGAIQVEKTKVEWHPEKIPGYLKNLYRKWRQKLLSGSASEGDHFFAG